MKDLLEYKVLIKHPIPIANISETRKLRRILEKNHAKSRRAGKYEFNDLPNYWKSIEFGIQEFVNLKQPYSLTNILYNELIQYA